MRLGSIVIGAAVLMATACGSDSSSGGGSPTTPTPPSTPAPTSLTISGSETLRTGQSESYTATLTLSNGTSQAASPSWASGNSGVLTIDSSGRAHAASQGSATITATTQGVTATRTISVYQDYQGTWTGTYRIRVCTEQGVFRGLLCDDTFPTGRLLAIRITLTQNAASASGTLELGSIVTNVSGGIFPSRHFIGGGSGTFPTPPGITFKFNIGTLDILSTATRLTGSIIFTITSEGVSGNTYVEADLADVTRTSSLAEPRSTPLLYSAEDVIRALRAK